MNTLQRAASGDLADRLNADALFDAASAQPALFSDFDPIPVVRAVRNYAHTGRAITADEQRVQKVAVMAAAGYSVRSICKKTGESRNTVSAAISELERQGKLEPLREVVGRRLAELVGDQMEVVGELLEKNGRTADQINDLKAGWVGVGVGLTHMAAARPIEVRHSHLHAVVPTDPARAYLDSLAAASAATADGFAIRCEQLADSRANDTGLETFTADLKTACAASTTDLNPCTEPAAAAATRANGVGGGGLEPGGPLAGDDGLLRDIFGSPMPNHPNNTDPAS